MIRGKPSILSAPGVFVCHALSFCARECVCVFPLVYVWDLTLSSVSTVCLASSNYGTKIHSLCLSEYAPLL